MCSGVWIKYKYDVRCCCDDVTRYDADGSWHMRLWSADSVLHQHVAIHAEPCHSRDNNIRSSDDARYGWSIRSDWLRHRVSS